MNIAGFEKVAQYLTHPLVVLGFVLMLFFKVHGMLLKSGVLPQVSKKDGGDIVKRMLRYGFWLGIALVLAMFLLQFSGIGLSVWNSYMEKEKVQARDANKLAREVIALQQKQLEAKDELIKTMTEAITALPKTGAPPKDINAAYQELEKGNTGKAQDIFAELAAAKEAAGKKNNQEAAEAYRHLGALAYMNKPKEALVAYQKAVQLDPDNTEGLNMLGLLLRRTGELGEAEEMLKKAVKVNHDSGCEKGTACASINLGIVYKTRGELDKGELLFKGALETSRSLGDKEGMAQAYTNLGDLYRIRDKLEQAEQMQKKALELHEALGNREGMAANYANLGIVYAIHGELERAEQMHRKALELNETLGSKGGMAGQYGNLGNMYQIHGELEQAEQMYRKSLELNEALGNKEGMARNYGNLGSVYAKRGNLDQAEQMYWKSLEFDEALGSKEGVAIDYGNLGIVYQTRGELGKAEEMYRKALEFNEALGRKEDMASAYVQLGFIYGMQGELDRVETSWKKSLSLFQAIQHPNANKVQQLLDKLDQIRARRL
ncbi:MAG: tetratricopeptide repeat protein [Candidatus Electrothrix sp. YB6]